MGEPSTTKSEELVAGAIDAVRSRSCSFPTPAGNATFGDAETERTFGETFDDSLANCRVLGLGEATHGTHEFFRFKARLIRYLVEQRGFRLLCMEAEFTAALALNEYVTDTTESNDQTAAAVLGDAPIIGNWQCEAVADLVAWLRRFNEGRAPSDQVAIHGIDAQRQHLPASALVSYLDRVDVDAPSIVRDALETLDSQPYMQLPAEEREAYREACRTVSDVLGAHLDANGSAYVEATSRRALRRASQQCRTIEQAGDLASAQEASGHPAYLDAREAAMARNVSWLLDHEATDRAAVWAHNSHIGRGSLYGHDGDVPALGERLAGEFGDGYCALGLTLGGGRVRIYSLSEAAFATPSIPEPPAGSLPRVLSRIGSSPFFLDIEAAGAESAVAAWFESAPRRHLLGGAYEDSPEEYVASDPREAFDGVVFFESTTQARAISGE